MSAAPDASPPEGGPGPDSGPGPPREPTFGELIRSNLRVVSYVLALAALAWIVWRGLLGLFPDTEWLQPGG